MADSFRQVKAPDGLINFPSNMSDEDVSSAMKKLYPAPAVISSRTPTNWERLQQAVPVLKGDWIHGSMSPGDVGQLAFPERAYTPAEQERHPIRTGVDQVLGSLTSPQNLLMLKGFQGLPGALNKVISGAFGGEMTYHAAKSLPEAKAAYDRGDIGEAKRIGTHVALGGAMAIAAGAHVMSGDTPGTTSNQEPVPTKQEFFSKDVLQDQANKRVIDAVSAPKDVRDIYASTGMKESHPAETSEQRQQYLRMTKEKGLGPPKTYDPVTGEPLETKLPQTPSLAERQGTPPQAQEGSPQQSPSTTTPSEAAGKSVLSPEEQLKKSFEKGSNDTEYFRQAREQLGEGASISDIAKKAQSLKSQRGSSSLAANPFSMAFEAKSALEKLYNDKIADPLIQKLGLGRSHTDIESHDPELADKIRLLDNAPRYFRQKAEAIIKRVVGDLDRDQERGFVLMADRDSRINLMMNHPDEYEQFRSDPAIMAALRRYKPEARLLGDAHEALGGNILNNQDYLSRVYYEHMGGIGKHPDAGNTNIPFERIIKPQKSLNKQRVEDAENYYNYGIHEFGPSFGTKYTGVMIKFARDRVARDFLSKATVIEKDDTMPSSISYQGKQYFSTETAAQMREGGEKNVNSYGVYSTGLRFYPLEVERIDHSISSTDPIKKTYPGVTSDSRRYLAPREITNTMNGLDAANEGKPSEIKRFFQEQIVGLGFGIPHYKNIMRRVSQTAPLGIANPVSWVRMFKVSFDSELKARALSGTDDPMFDLLAKQGAISSESQISRFKQYIGGNFNPANWVKPIAKIGHDFLFDSGGIDQRARLAMGDLVKSQHPEFSDSRIAQAVNEQLGNYNKRNWTEMQRGLSRFMLFPGWDMSSAAWVIRHPIKTSVPSALVVFMANKAIHSLGYNKESDKNDIFAIHLGTRTIVDNSLNEPLSKVVAGPVLRGAEAKLQGKSWDRAINEASRDFAKDVAKPVTMLRPDLTFLPELKVNKDFGTNKPIYGEQDWNRPGLLANKMVDKMSLHVVSKLIPQVGHAIEATQDGKFDFTQFLGNNLGIYNYPDDPVISLRRKIAASNTFISSHKQSVTSAQVAAALHSDPDATVYTAFRPSMENQLDRLKNIETMRTRVSLSRATDERKEAQYKILDRQKEAEEAQARKLDASIEKTLARIHSRNK